MVRFRVTSPIVMVPALLGLLDASICDGGSGRASQGSAGTVTFSYLDFSAWWSIRLASRWLRYTSVSHAAVICEGWPIHTLILAVLFG